MLRISIVNTKGGCGKTTVATNLASYCASHGHTTTLLDFDRQACSSQWLKRRAEERPKIHAIEAFQPPPPGMTRSWQLQLPTGTRYAISDTPAGCSGAELSDRVAEADVLLIPVLPSSIDIHSTAEFIRQLATNGSARLANKRIAFVTNRNRIRTRAADKLERFLGLLKIPVVARIRDTQQYIAAAEQGLGIHELDERDGGRDAETWATIFDWIEQREHTDLEDPIPVTSALQSLLLA